ncbi:MAG: porin [Ferrovibrio sp.]|uniref:porin n=1 Tax=Ferrovibrio sp. TaxID=1917215 RepID=UPI00391BCE4B
MNKTLLLQTALVAATTIAFAGIASAQTKAEPIAVSVGGYMNRGIKVIDFDDGASNQVDRRGTGFYGDAEVYFNIRAVLDNGVRFGGRIELEGSTESDQIDESYMFIEHSNYGRAEIGSTDRAASKMMYGAPVAVPGLSTMDFTGQVSPIVAPSGARTTNVTMKFVNGNDDAEGLNLYSARYFGSKAGKGLQLGLGYAPDECQDSTGSTSPCLASTISSVNSTGPANQRQLVANYLESFGAFDVGVFTAYQRYDLETITRNLEGYTAGANVTYNLGDGSSVSLGAGYKKEEISTSDDRKAWNVGLRYLTNGVAPGSIGVGIEYFVAKADDGTGVTRGDDKLTWIHAGVTYQLASGIQMFGGVGQYSFDDNTGAAAQEPKNNFGIVGARLDF